MEAPPIAASPVMNDVKIEVPSSTNKEMPKIEMNQDFSKEKVQYNKPSSQNPNNNSISFQNIDNNILRNNDKMESKDVAIFPSNESFHSNIYLSIRSQFMLKVYGILLFQFIITFGLILITQINKIKSYLLKHNILCIVSVSISAFIFLTAFILFLCNPKLMRKVPLNYFVLFLITICESIILVYISIIYSYQYILGAISYVTAICLSIFFIALFNKIEIKYLAMSFISVLFLMLTYGLLALIFRNYYLIFLYCFLGALLFTLYIVYDTILIRDEFDIDDYIFAALTLYFDIIRLFILILRLLGSRSRN